MKKFLGRVVNMAQFSYKAYENSGSRVQGVVEAGDINQARIVLHNKRLMVSHLHEKKIEAKSDNPFLRKEVTPKELEFLTSEMSLLLNSGVTINRSLEVLIRNPSSNIQSKLVNGLYDAVRQGESLSGAMSAAPNVFNPLYINLVKLGESTGSLPKVFSRLAEDIKFQAELKSKIIQALTYPTAIFVVCVVCLVFIFNYIIPQMSGLFEGVSEIPTYTAFLLGVSGWMISYQWFLLLGSIVSIASLFIMMKTPSFAVKFDKVLLRLPVIKNISLMTERIRFNNAVAMMLDSGVLIDRCLEMAVGSIRNQSIQQHLRLAKERVRKGESLAATLISSPLYSDFAISLIEVGEESGRLEPAFTEISDRSKREFEGWMMQLTSLLEPLLILFMGGVVGGGVVTMLLSILSVNDIGL